LVGSSSSNKSGALSSRRHRATRRLSPPDKVVTEASAGGRRSASIACSSWAVEFPGVGLIDAVLYLALLFQDLLHLVWRQFLQSFMFSSS
jgi:hypothetical protein